MIPVKKLTPLAFGYRVTSRQPPQPELTVIMRAKLTCEPGQPMELWRGKLADLSGEEGIPPEAVVAMEEGEYILGQGPLQADVFEDDDDERQGQVVYPSDFAEFKTKADIMVKGSCHPPKGRATACNVSVTVGDVFHKLLQVSGPRVWVDKVLGGKHTEPLEFKSLPVDYRHAYGGPGFPDNPAGKGHEGDELPNVEDPRFPITRAGQKPRPAGFGPINPEWPLRRNKVGKSYGAEWEKTRAPWYAEDYDFAHQNAAPEDQQPNGYLRGDEKLRFLCLHPRAVDCRVQLPGLRPRAFVMLKTGEIAEAPMACDTLFADLDQPAVYLTWRGHVKVKEDDLSDVGFMLLAHEHLTEPKKPAKEYIEQLKAFAADPMGFNDTPAAKLAAWEDKLEQGELDKRLDGLPDSEDPVTAVFGEVMGLAAGGDKTIAELRDRMLKLLQADPAARPKVIEELKKALCLLREGQGGGGASVSADKGVAAGPFMRGVLRKVADAQKDAVEQGADLTELNEEVQKALSAAKVAGVDDKDLRIPAPDEPPPQPAPEVDFSGHDLSERDFSGLDLHGCNFEGANLSRANFTGCNLRGASFFGVMLSGTRLTEADCTGCDFTLAMFHKTSCTGAKLSEAKLDQASAYRADFSGADLSRASATTFQCHKSRMDGLKAEQAEIVKAFFDCISLKEASFKRANLKGTTFRQCPLVGARFDGADVSKGAFMECDLTRGVLYQVRGDTTNFQGTTLRDADFSHAVMPSAIFLAVAARHTRFFAADLPLARFYRAVLREASFEKANLFGADLRKTSLTKTSFCGANLYRGNFTEAFGTDADFRKANLTEAGFLRNKLVMRT